jgi:hypothetical protein
MAQIQSSNDDGVNPHTGNIRADKVGDVNSLLRALVERKRVARFDLLGRPLDTDDDD